MGESGFMSHMSIWLGPPDWKRRMTLRPSFRAAGAGAAVASLRKRWANIGPPKETRPACRKPRRVMCGAEIIVYPLASTVAAGFSLRRQQTPQAEACGYSAATYPIQ